MPKGTESSIGLLSILMWIKEHYNQNVFIGLEISNLTIFHQIKRFKKFWKVKFLKSQAGFELLRLTDSNPLRYAATCTCR